MAEQYPTRRFGSLTVRINRGRCIGSANCTKVAPQVFELDDTQVVAFRPDAQEVDRDQLIEACRVCPVEALAVLDEHGRQIVPTGEEHSDA